MLRFYSHLFGTNINQLQVFADTGTGWNLISTIVPGAQTGVNSPWSLNEIQLPDYAETTVRFRFRGMKDATINGWAEIGLDNVELVEAPIPACTAPSGITATGIGVTNATVNFTPGGTSISIIFNFIFYLYIKI